VTSTIEVIDTTAGTVTLKGADGGDAHHEGARSGEAEARSRRRPLTDDQEEIRKFAGFVAGLGNVERVAVLPFHQMGRFKYEKLGIKYALADAEPPSQEAVERACAVFRAAGLKTY